MGNLEPQHLTQNSIPYETVRENAWIVLNQLQDRKQFSDLIITCRGEEYFAHRCILAAVSPYFKTLLLGAFPLEKIGDSVKTDLSNFSPSCVQLFLALVYQKTHFDASGVDHLELLKLFDFLQIHSYDDVIIDAIRGDIDIDNCWNYIGYGAALRIDKLRNLAIIFIVSNAQECFRSKSFTQASADAIITFIMSDICQSLSADFIVDSIIRWVKEEQSNRKQHFHEIVEKLHTGWTIRDTELIKLAALAPDLKLPLKRKSSKRLEDNYSVIMHYDADCNVHDILQHCFYDIGALDDICKNLEPLSVLLKLKYTQDEFNKRKSVSRGLCFWQNTLYIAAIQWIQNDEDFYENLLIAKYNQTNKSMEVKLRIILSGIDDSESYSDSDGSLDSQRCNVWASVAGIHCYQGILYIALELHITKMYSCLLLKVNADDYKEVGNRIKLEIKKEKHNRLRFAAEGNHIYLVSAHEFYHIDASSGDKVQCYRGISYGFSYQVVLHKGSLYGIDSQVLAEKSLEFYRFDFDFWYHLFTIDLSDETIVPDFHRNQDKVHMLSHGSVLYIHLPIFLGQKNGYREVHIETGKLGDAIFELDDVYFTSRYISLPKTLLL